MKLKEYLEKLNTLATEHPEAMEMEVVTSKDDEGNGYNAVYYDPGIGHYDSRHREFESETDEPNAVCLN